MEEYISILNDKESQVWDFAAIHMSGVQPLIVIRGEGTFEIGKETVKFGIAGDLASPLEEGKVVRCFMMLPKDAIKRVEFYKNKSIISAPNAGKLVSVP